MRLDDFLDNHHVPFERLHHRPAYTAQRRAQQLHVRGKEVAKSVLLRTDQGYVLGVLPADHRIDREAARCCLGSEWVEMASETEIEQLFPDCERGAMPPFGSLYHLQTLVDESLAEDDRIVFEAHNHEEAIRMTYEDYESLEHPRKGRFAHHV
jgi:Ala-tRNA(Pro) deacylase